MSNSDGLRIALLISGRGSTAAAIIRHFQNSKLVKPVCAIASNTNAGVVNLINAGLSEENISVISPKLMKTSVQFGDAILALCKKHEVDLIGHYGWLVKTPWNVIAEYRDMIINQHPGPLDPGREHDFGGQGMYGKRVHYTRLNFVKETNKNWWTEATCHRITDEYDKGAILDRIQVPIQESDTVDSLADRVLVAEHALHIKVLEDFAQGRVQEWQRPEALVKNYEEKVLTRIKEEAIRLYPKG